MKKLINPFILMFLVVIPGFSFSQTKELKDLIRPGAQLEKLSGSFSFTEGPAPDAMGNVYFTDQPNDRIMIWTTTGELKTFMQPCGRSNGMHFDKQGNLWSCADQKNELWMIGKDKSVTVVLGQFSGKALNGPNDLWITPSGGVYITDPFYLRTWWDHTAQPQESQCVYFLSPDHKTLLKVVDDMVRPNGIIGTPDGKVLYIADIGGNKTWSYIINPDGKLSDKKLFCEMGSDGMTIDEQGNVYISGNGVTIFDKNGNKIGNIPVAEKWTANVCFGDADGKSLFITATTGLYRMKMQVAGADR
jgi:gluconolactonase